MGAIGELGHVSEKGGRVRLRPDGRVRVRDLWRGFHLCLGVSDRIGSSPPQRRAVYHSVWMETCKEKADPVEKSGGSQKEGENVREGLGTLPVRQTLALILQTVWKIRAVFQVLLEPVLRVKMSYDSCVVILLHYSKTSI